MRIIICGAGRVGYSIAAYLSRENNDVTVIDHDADLIARVNSNIDANGIVGNASSPDILEKAGANDADMIAAVTHQDEVNMVACQVAHSIFNVPKKIARIRNQVFRDPVWANLFSRAHMPIDVIISPEVEVARAVDMRLSVPGTTSVTPMNKGNLFLCSVLCEENCPVVNTPLRQLATLFPDNKIRIVSIVRNGKHMVPKADDQMLIDDEVFFIAEKSQLKRILDGFGHEEQDAHNVIIVGGGNIGVTLSEIIREEHKDVGIKVIESNDDRAQYLSERLDDVLVLNASGLDRKILEEANIKKTDTLIALTNDDETNILVCLLARQYGCERVIPLVNKESYNPLTASLGFGAVVSPKAITVSNIMKHVRRGRVKAVHNLFNFAELLEIEASDAISILNTPLYDLHLPKGVLIAAIVRDDQVIMPTGETTIKPKDHVIVLASQGMAAQVEKMFLAPVDIF